MSKPILYEDRKQKNELFIFSGFLNNHFYGVWLLNNFVLFSAVHWSESAICICTSLASCTPLPHPQSHPSSNHRAPSQVPCAILQVEHYFTEISVIYVKPNFPIYPTLLTPSPMSTHPFSTFASLYLPWNSVHLYHFSRFHIYALIHSICFSLFIILHSVWQILGPSTSLQMTQFHYFISSHSF